MRRGGARRANRRSRASDIDAKKLPRLSTRELLRLLRPYFWPDGAFQRFRAVSCFIILALSKTANVVAPIFLGEAVDRLAGDNTVPWFEISAFIVLSFATKALKEFQSFVYLRVQQTAYLEVAKTTFRHLHSLSLEWHLNKKTGQVLRSMDRGILSANTVVRYLFLYLGPTIVETFVVCIIFGVRYESPAIAAVAFASVLAYCTVTYFLTKWRTQIRKRMNERDNDAHDKAVDSLVNFETVKYFTNEEYELNRYATAMEHFQKASVATQASLNVLNAIQQAIIYLALLGGLLIVADAITEGDRSIGDFTAVMVYMQQLFQPLSFLGSVYACVWPFFGATPAPILPAPPPSAIVQAFVDMRNLSELLAQRPDVRDAPGSSTLEEPKGGAGLEVEFRDVAFRYPKQDVSSGLRGVSFKVPSGRTLAVVGHSGAGKSTIIRLLFRFYDVADGQILIGGRDIRSVTQQSLRQLIGIVPQDTVLFNDTVVHNIGYGRPGAPHNDVVQAAVDAQIHPFIETLTKQYESVVGERGLKLSGGEKQRVAIARTLLKNPPVLVLDEATSSLDTITERGIQEALARVKQGRTTIVIAHRLSTIRDADQILVLDKGQVVERGTHTDLLTANGRYAALWAEQSAAAEGLFTPTPFTPSVLVPEPSADAGAECVDEKDVAPVVAESRDEQDGEEDGKAGAAEGEGEGVPPGTEPHSNAKEEAKE